MTARAGAGLAAAALLAAASVAAEPDVGAQIERLQAQIETLQAELARLREQVEAGSTVAETVAAPAPGEASTAAAAPERTRLDVGGRVKLDLIGNSVSEGGFSGNNRNDVSLSVADVPVTGDGESDQLSFSVRHSRLWLEAMSPSPFGELSGYLEFDLFAADSGGNEQNTNSYEPRMRHAYGEWGPLLGGQTFTTFQNASAFPELNDDGGPAGLINARQAQVRYTHRLRRSLDPNGTAWHLAVALESPETTVIDVAGAQFAPDDDRLPDLTARLGADGLWGNVILSGVLRELRIDAASGDDTALAGAVSVSGRVFLGRRDDLRFSLNWGEGIGRYMSYNAFADALLGGDGELDPISAAGAFLALQHWWNRTWRSTLALGAAGELGNEDLPDTANDWVGSVHANLLWSPVLQASVGLEYMWAARQRADGADGELHRLQFTAIYKF